MILTTTTRTGWTIEQDGCRRDGALSAGAIRGRKWHYSADSLRAAGIDPASDPLAPINEHGTTAAEYLVERVMPDRVLAHGHTVR